MSYNLTPTSMSTNVIFARRTESNDLKVLPITSSTKLADLINCDVFTVFADTPAEAFMASQSATAKVSFEGVPQTGATTGKDGATRHYVRVWKSAPATTDATSILGI